MSVLCRLGLHRWDWWSVRLNGPGDEWREARCLRWCGATRRKALR